MCICPHLERQTHRHKSNSFKGYRLITITLIVSGLILTLMETSTTQSGNIPMHIIIGPFTIVIRSFLGVLCFSNHGYGFLQAGWKSTLYLGMRLSDLYLFTPYLYDIGRLGADLPRTPFLFKATVALSSKLFPKHNCFRCNQSGFPQRPSLK